MTAVAFLLASSLYAGFQWTIRMVVYPQLATVSADDFPAYEENHQRLLTRTVGPLFAALVLTVLALLAAPPEPTPVWGRILAVVLIGLLLALTGLGAVPMHRRLSGEFDAAAYRRLLAVDTARLVVAAATCALACYLVLAEGDVR